MGTTTDFAKGWFAARGWQPFEFQREVWAPSRGQPACCTRPPAPGKTYAVWFGALAALAAPSSTAQRKPVAPPLPSSGSRRCARSPPTPRARCSAPLRRRSASHWSVGVRTGDTGRGRARAAGPPAARPRWSPRPESLTPDADARADAQSALATRAAWSSSTNGTS